MEVDGGKENCLCDRCPRELMWGRTAPEVSCGRLSNASIENGFCVRNAECTPDAATLDPEVGEANADMSPPTE